MSTIKPLLASVFLYLFSLIVALSVSDILLALSKNSLSEVYQLLFVGRLLPSANYLSITLLMIAEIFLLNWICKRIFAQYNLDLSILGKLFIFVLGIWLINSSHNPFIILLGMLFIAYFTVALGYIMFNSCNAQEFKTLNNSEKQ